MTDQSFANTDTQTPTPSTAAAALTIGFGGTLLVAFVAWCLFLFNRNTPLMGAFLISGALYGAWCAIELRAFKGSRLRAGVLGGVIGASALSVFVGSLISTQSESLDAFEHEKNTLSASGMLTFGLIALAMVALGAIVGTITAKAKTPARDIDWRARFAWVCAASYLPLILVGGVVTGTESGMAVPDSVTTYGSVSMLFPMSLMDDTRIYLEHSHRLFGTFAGLATIVLVVLMLARRARVLPRLMSIALLIAVSAQGVMGALRVSEGSAALASLHGVLAQLVFALAIATGVVCSRGWIGAHASEDARPDARSTRLFLIITGIALFIQLVFGSLTRHTDSAHPLMSHVGFSFIVVILVIIVGAKVIKLGKRDQSARAIRPYGAILHGIVVLQFVMGWGALAMTRTGDEGHPPIPSAEQLADAHPIRVGETIVTSTHHVLGALLLGTLAAALVWALRLASKRAIR